MLTFDQDKHIYFWKDKPVPNVTRLLQDYGLADLSNAPRDRLAYKSALGLAVHYAIDLYNQNNLDEDSIHPEIKPYFLAYKKFTEITKFEPKDTELKLYSKKCGFAGTLDAHGLFMWNGKERHSIIDWKCSWVMYASNAPQLSAYKILLEENFKGLKVRGLFGLQLKATGNYELIEYPDDGQTFLACLVLHKWKVKHGLIKEGVSNGNGYYA